MEFQPPLALKPRTTFYVTRADELHNLPIPGLYASRSYLPAKLAHLTPSPARNSLCHTALRPTPPPPQKLAHLPHPPACASRPLTLSPSRPLPSFARRIVSIAPPAILSQTKER